MAGDARKKDRCCECLAEFVVKRDGTIRYHGPHNRPCPGGGRPPAVMDDPRAGDGWARALIDHHAAVPSTKEPTGS
jgi:hypothetical protein